MRRGRSSIRSQVMTRFGIFLMCMVVAVVIIITMILGRFILAQNVRREEQVCELLVESMDAYFRPTINMMDTISADEDTQYLIEHSSEMKMQEKSRRILEFFGRLRTTEMQYWYTVSLYIDGSIWHDLKSGIEVLTPEQYLSEEWYDAEREGRYFSAYHTSFIKINTRRDNVISIVSPIYCISDRSRQAILIIEILFDNIAGLDLLENVDGLAIVNDRGEFIYEYRKDMGRKIAYPVEEILELGEETADYRKDDNGFYIVKKSELSDWIITIYITNQSILAPILSVMILAGIMLLVTITIIMTLLLKYMMNTVVLPIAELSQTMRCVTDSGNMDVELSLQNSDEFENLSYCFHTMLRSIRRNSEKILTETRMRQEVEYALLVSQMNPHFIYNCLNNINMMLLLNRNAEARKITENLAAILVYDIRLGEANVMNSIRKEIEIVMRYVEIEQIRYPDAFDLQWDLGPDVEEKEIPKMILQPLVENAIVHGIIPSGEKHTVHVMIRRENDFLHLCVSNDGIPFDEEAIVLLNQNERLPKSEHSTRIGLSNIKERISYLYKKDYSFTIQVVDGRTRIDIFLPQ